MRKPPMRITQKTKPLAAAQQPGNNSASGRAGSGLLSALALKSLFMNDL
jgi:hypothetical protein